MEKNQQTGITADIKGTPVFKRNFLQYQKKEKRIIVNEGGRGSSKTYSLAQLFFFILVGKEQGLLLTVSRKTLPALRATAMKDFFEIMKSQGVYREANHNKSEHIYKYRGNEIEFISVDQEQKIRGRKRQYLWMNEANEFKYNDFRQLVMRTERQIFMDYNPSDEYHWIYDNVLTRNDAEKIHSTYLDNKHLNPEIIKEIERLRGMDQNYWRIYGLGLRGASEAKIYTHWQLCDALPENPDEIVYGLDFGFNNPTALVKIAAKDKNFYWQEKLYQSFLTNTQLIEKLGTFEIGNAIIYADSAEPARIAEIKRAGFNIKPAKKEVKERIDFIKSHEFHITKDSVNVQKEAKSYSWKLKDEKPTDEPVKDNDHLMDAGGYAIYTRFGHRIKTKLEWI